MKSKTLFFIIFLWMPIIMIAQNGLSTSAGAKGVALNDAMVTAQGIYSSWSNPSGLTNVNQVSFALSGQQRFALANLNDVGLVSAIPTRFGVIGVAFQYFGFEAYQEQKIGLIYARQLFKTIALGIQFNYLNTQITDYGNKGVPTVDIGLQAQLTKTLRLGAVVYNPIAIEVIEDETLATLLAIGLSYQPSSKLTISTEVKKDITLPARVVLGINYQLLKQFALRFGIGSKPASYSFDIGLKLNKFNIDIASKYYQVLGFTPAFSLSYTLNTPK